MSDLVEGPCKACESTAKANDYLKRQCGYKDEIIKQRNAWCSRQFKKIKRLQSELDRYKNGHQGSCYTCEPVAKENERLRAALERTEKDRNNLLCEMQLIFEGDYENGEQIHIASAALDRSEALQALHTKNGYVDTQIVDDDE